MKKGRLKALAMKRLLKKNFEEVAEISIPKDTQIEIGMVPSLSLVLVMFEESGTRRYGVLGTQEDIAKLKGKIQASKFPKTEYIANGTRTILERASRTKPSHESAGLAVGVGSSTTGNDTLDPDGDEQPRTLAERGPAMTDSPAQDAAPPRTGI